MSAALDWQFTDTVFPTHSTLREQLAFALKSASLASSKRLWQPWHYRLEGNFVDLLTRSSPSRVALDPEGRETMMSCGAALEHVATTLKSHGCLRRIDSFPDLDQPDWVARLYAGHSARRQAVKDPLLHIGSCEGRDADYGEGSTDPDAALNLLGKTAANERSWLEIPRGEVMRKRLRGLAAQRHPMPVEEPHLRGNAPVQPAATGWEPNRADPNSLFGRFSRWRKPQLTLRINVFPAPQSEAEDNQEFDASTGTFAVIKSKTDDKHGWIAAGQTLARLRLQGQALDRSWTLCNDALRNTHLRAELRTEFGRKGFVQAILCWRVAPPQHTIQPTTTHLERFL